MPAEKFPGASPYLPGVLELPALQSAVQKCQGCDLYCRATQAVFGEGASDAGIMLIGEEPGDAEDRQGHPFVGPAGKLLRRALGEAQIEPAVVYVTNAVKHFKFEERGKRRIHKKPSLSQVEACAPWLEAEARLIRPTVIICLGATAAQAVLGKEFRLTRSHGQFQPHPWASYVTATLHPSAVLRAPDRERRHQMYAQLVGDLGGARALLEKEYPIPRTRTNRSGA
jgi:uracil-DNA glycosylase